MKSLLILKQMSRHFIVLNPSEKSYRDSWRQNQAQDKQIMQAIYKFKFAKIDTVRLCEDGIKEVDNFRSKLNNSSQFRNEIDQILQLIKDKIANYQKSLVSLRDDLDKVDNLTDLERIHRIYQAVFCL